MNGKVNYEIFHLSELEDALKNIDEAANPEEADLIKKLIAKGGYKYPESLEVRYPIWDSLIDTKKCRILTVLVVNLFTFITYGYHKNFTIYPTHGFWSIVLPTIIWLLGSVPFATGKTMYLAGILSNTIENYIFRILILLVSSCYFPIMIFGGDW